MRRALRVCAGIALAAGLGSLTVPAPAQDSDAQKSALACPKCGKPGTGKFCSDDGAELARADAVALHVLLSSPQPSEVGRGLTNPLNGLVKDGKVDLERLHALITAYDELVKSGKLGAPAPAPPPAASAMPTVAPEPAFKLPGRDADGEVTCLAPSADGAYLCVGYEKGAVHFWDVPKRERVSSANHQNARVLAVGTHPFAPLVGHASSEFGVKFTLIKSTRSPRLREGSGSITRLAFSPDGTHLATGDGRGELAVWDLWSGTSYRKFAAGSAGVTGISFNPEGSQVAVSNDDGKLVVADVAQGKLVCELAAHDGGCSCVAWSRDGRAIASGGADGVVRLFAPGGKALRRLGTPGKRAVALAFHPKSDACLATASTDGRVRVWDVNAGEAVAELVIPATVNAIAWNPEGTALFVASGGSVQCHEVKR
ncbi:MAG TPA: hypothetical protein VFF73_29260 [Planctomycetota bacterium]|nr:hypothetical protein [Planctomycetota bacterium]